MARTGGTVICRCLASMKGVVLLSEIHPLGTQTFNPLHQAHAWYDLLSNEDLESARSGRLSFLEAMQLISQRCTEQGKILVVRDWSHLDYTGVPFTQPSYRSLLAEKLQSAFALVRYSTVRHPLDQWLSVARQPVFQERLGPARFLRGANRFADAAVQTGFMRFEDFTRDNDTALRQLCAGLELEFDPGYREKWQSYTHVTGDILSGRGGGDHITPLPRQAMGENEKRRLCSLPQYQAIINSLGYAE
jgi:protein O-GlcNAc transferase